MKEIERFEVRDDKGKSYIIVRSQEWSGGVKTYQNLQTLLGDVVNADTEDPDLFWLRTVFNDDWISARRVC